MRIERFVIYSFVSWFYNIVTVRDKSSYTLQKTYLFGGLLTKISRRHDKRWHLEELNLSKPEYDSLKKLSSNEEIVIHKSDKGNSVVIVNRVDYINRMQEVVNDTSKFEKIDVAAKKDYNFMTKETKEVNSLLGELLSKHSISQD